MLGKQTSPVSIAGWENGPYFGQQPDQQEDDAAEPSSPLPALLILLPNSKSE